MVRCLLALSDSLLSLSRHIKARRGAESETAEGNMAAGRACANVQSCLWLGGWRISCFLGTRQSGRGG